MQRDDTPPSDVRATPKRPILICKHCGKEFVPKGGSFGWFCSRGCYWSWRRTTGAAGYSRLEGARFPETRVRTRQPTDWQRQLFKNPEKASEDCPEDDLLWAERGRYWEEQADAASKETDILRLEERKPLVLSGHGVRLTVDHGTLLVRHGFTHYPQQEQKHRFFPGDLKLPSRIILLSTDGSISLGVARWLSEQRVPLVILDYRGAVVSVLGTETTASDLSLRRAQMEAVSNGAGLRVACRLIEQKLENSLTTLESIRESEERTHALMAVADGLKQLRHDPPANADELRWLEGLTAVAYFAAWRRIPVIWKRTGKHPIPTEWKQVGTRADLLSSRNRHARHPVNAMLNYGYAVLESQVRVAVSKLGLDPTIGYLHSNRSGRQALLYDLMEPFRPQVDRRILELVRTMVFEPRDFVVDAKGVCRLHSQLARHVTQLIADASGSQIERGLKAAMYVLKTSSSDLSPD
jgi:CRISPR-associated endonuclease Cas1